MCLDSSAAVTRNIFSMYTDTGGRPFVRSTQKKLIPNGPHVKPFMNLNLHLGTC